MKWLAGMLLMMTVLCGCGPSVIVNGDRYDALTETEEEKLVLMARAALKRSPKAVNPTELMEILREEPKVRILYTGDRTGNARVTWDAAGRQITVVFRGHLLDDDMEWLLETRANPDEIIDQSKPGGVKMFRQPEGADRAH